MHQIAKNGLTLTELERIEEAAYHSQSISPETVLRLTVALREALQLKVNACALCPHCLADLNSDDLEVSVNEEVRKCLD